MQWFQAKEKSAGNKRLLLTYYIYKVFGRYAVYTIGFFVALITLIFSKDLRYYTKKYLKIISEYKDIKPTFINQLKQVFSYSISLADKMIVYSGKYNSDNIIFENEEDKKQLFDDIKQNKGVCFLFAHVGNIEILQSFFQKQKEFPGLKVNVFLNRNQTKIFNNFLDKIKTNIPIKYLITEDFDISSAIKLKENLDSGEILFIAGDRLSEFNSDKVIEKIMFAHKINLPKGSFSLIRVFDKPTYFISAIKESSEKYTIIVKKAISKDITTEYTKFLERIILNNPFQFYHFYDFFID